MPRRTLAAVLVLVLTAALAAATTASARSNDTRLGLVGYAVPREALGAIIKAWNETPGGQGRLLQPVLRRVGRPGAGRRQRPAGPTSSSSPPGSTST